MAWFFDKLASDERGSIAPMVAVGALAIIIMAGGQTDFAARNAKEVAVQAAVDAAALSLAAEADATPEDLQAAAQEVFDANLSSQSLSKVENFSLAATSNGGLIEVPASGDYQTNFLPLIGLSELRIDVKAIAQSRSVPTPVEHVLLLDTTTSILGSGAQRAAITNAVTSAYGRIIQAKNSGADITASFVPFSDRVNLSDFNSVSRKGDTNPLGLTTNAFPAEGNGCFEPRINPRPGFPFSLDDAPPGSGVGLFEYTDTFGTTGLAILGDIDENGDGVIDHQYRGNTRPLHVRSPICPVPTLIDVMSRGQVQSTLGKASAMGTGRFDEALAWGWRLLSPRWQGELGVSADYPSSDPNVRKIITLVTDGKSLAWEWEAGGANGVDHPFVPNNQLPDFWFDQIVDLCNRIKATGIEIEVVLAFSYSRARDPFRKCASPGRFTEVVSDAALVSEIGNFSGLASEVRLIE